MQQKKSSGLGRGLSSLIPQKKEAPEPQAADVAVIDQVVAPQFEKLSDSDRVYHVKLGDIQANPEQPRMSFHHKELEDLMNSIREHGVIQPLTVTRRDDGGFELVAGERRMRACMMLGLETVPVIVREAKRDEKLLLALIENIQRADLNPIEEAKAYQRLCDEFDMTQEAVAKRVGKARPTIANTIRLLVLPIEVQDAIGSGVIPQGSARALLSLPDAKAQLKFFKKLLNKQATTREIEAGVREAVGRMTRRDPAVAAAEEELRGALGAKVEIKKKDGQGTISLSFYSDEEYDALVARLMGA